MIKAVIFDLDNCLAPATGVGVELYQPAFDAIRRANQGHLSDEVLEEAFAEIWRHPLDWVMAKHAFPEAVITAAWEVFTVMEVSLPMKGYGDLAVLGELPVLRYLVTSGFRRLQESKITALGLRDVFDAVHVDAIDEPGRLGKQGLFERIMADYGLVPPEVLVVGDNADSEIAAGNRLGIRTVQTLRPGVPRTDSASFHVESLDGIRDLLASLKAWDSKEMLLGLPPGMTEEAPNGKREIPDLTMMKERGQEWKKR